jgi:hypothetical protein
MTLCERLKCIAYNKYTALGYTLKATSIPLFVTDNTYAGVASFSLDLHSL